MHHGEKEQIPAAAGRRGRGCDVTRRREQFDRREALLAAALSEFSRNSYETASLNAILREAGVSKGVFYYYFRDKRDLYNQLFRDLSARKLAFFAEELKGQPLLPGEGETLFDFLKRLMGLGARLFERYPQMYEMSRQFARESEAFRGRFNADFREDYQGFLRPMIAAAAARGDFSDRFPIEFIERILTYMLTHYYDIIHAETGETPGETLDNLSMFYDFLERGLARKEGTDRSVGGRV
jgi:AcrR family transcriptional regulator